MNRTNFEMTQGDLDRIMDACKPVPYMVFGGMPPRSPQENANAAWAELGSRMGFDYMTVEPISGQGPRFFSASPSPAGAMAMQGMLGLDLIEHADSPLEAAARKVCEARKRIPIISEDLGCAIAELEAALK